MYRNRFVDAQAAIVAQPVVAGNVLYAGTATGRLTAFPAGACSVATCTPAYAATLDTNRAVRSLIVDDGVVYVTNAAGNLGAYKLP